MRIRQARLIPKDGSEESRRSKGRQRSVRQDRTKPINRRNISARHLDIGGDCGDDIRRTGPGAKDGTRRAGRICRGIQQEAKHPHDLGRRYRPVQCQRLHLGVMGYRTPNIDRIAKEGMLFTD